MNQIIEIETGIDYLDKEPRRVSPYPTVREETNVIISSGLIDIPPVAKARWVPVEVQQSFTLALGLSLEFE